MGDKSQANTSPAQRWPSQCWASEPNWVRAMRILYIQQLLPYLPNILHPSTP